jgi:hypothetical protein
LQDPPKLKQIGIFGVKICHLASLLSVKLKPVKFFLVEQNGDQNCITHFPLI